MRARLKTLKHKDVENAILTQEAQAFCNTGRKGRVDVAKNYFPVFFVDRMRRIWYNHVNYGGTKSIAAIGPAAKGTK
jgi:hypothetical protein